MNFLPRDKYLPPSEIHLEIAERKHRLADIGGRSGGMAKSSPHPCEELIDPERLRHIIVGTEVERGNFGLLLIARGEHEDGDGCPLTDLANDFGAIPIGQTQVDQNDVRISCLRLRKPVCSSGRLIEPVAMVG